MLRTAVVATLTLAACGSKDPAATPTTPPATTTTSSAVVDAAPAVADTPPPPDAVPEPEGPTPCDQIVAHVAGLGHEIDDCSDDRATAADVACYLGAQTFAATWPCYAAIAARNVMADSKDLQGSIVTAAMSYASEHKEFPTGKTGLVPKTACCKTKDHLCHHAAKTWTKGVWRSLLPDGGPEATVFQVSYASKDGTTFEVHVIADIDCDGHLLDWRTNGTWLGGDIRLENADPEFDD